MEPIDRPTAPYLDSRKTIIYNSSGKAKPNNELLQVEVRSKSLTQSAHWQWRKRRDTPFCVLRQASAHIPSKHQYLVLRDKSALVPPITNLSPRRLGDVQCIHQCLHLGPILPTSPVHSEDAPHACRLHERNATVTGS